MRLRARIGTLMLMTLLALAGCGTAPTLPAGVAVKLTPPAPSAPQLPPAGSGRGGYYQDDGPGANPPPDLDSAADAEVKNEPYFARNSKPYVVFGNTITPITDQQPFVQHGLASWYGKKFHGQRTASGERYDMYKMTAAHPTLPIPSYVRVTSMVSGKQVILRINDRGPFHSKRIIDVSYTAALQLGLLEKGSHDVQVERLLAPEIERIRAVRFATAPSDAPPLPVLSKPNSALNSALKVAPPRLDDELMAQGELAPTPALLLAATGGPSDSAADSGVAVSTDVEQPAPVITEELASGYYLQLGAFSHAENAQVLRARLASWADNGKPLLMLSKSAKYRLFSGPFSSRAEAAEAAATLPARLRLKPMIVQR